MRFYSVVLFTSSALLACYDSVLTASGINSNSVDHTSEIDQNGFAINRLLQTNDTMGEKEEERVSFSELSKVADSALTHATSPLRTSIGAVSKFTESKPVDFKRVFRSYNTNAKRNLANIKQGLKDPELDKLIKSYDTKQDLVDDLIHTYQHENVALALYEVKASEKSTEKLATQLYNTYFEGLVTNKETPLSMLDSWNKGKPLRTIFSRTPMIKVLGEFVEYYNKNSQTKTTLLQTLRDGFKNDYELAPVLAHAKREGDETAEILQKELVQEYTGINKGLAFEDVLKTRLTETDYHLSWDFDTLYEFAKLSTTEENLLQTFKTGFGGDDKLARALAGARKTDSKAKLLLIQLVQSYQGKSLEDVLNILKLDKHNLTTNDVKVLRTFVHHSSPDTKTQLEWTNEISMLIKKA